MMHSHTRKSYSPRRSVAWAVLVLVAAFAGGIMAQAVAQSQRQAQAQQSAQKNDPYRRPEPTRPAGPTIGTANRYQTNRVFLERADSLYRLPGDTSERQIVKGDVMFRQGGMYMYCDSAYYFAALNSLDAFGHVRMEQGDTLFVYADKVYYDGDIRLARLRNGPSRSEVTLIDRDVTLTTDSLDYSLTEERGWYERGGRLDDKVNVLTSVFGQYNTATKEAEFFWNVVLDNNRDGFRMLTDTLYYSTLTNIASIVSPTRIMGKNDTIITSRGWYNTNNDNAELTSRSIISHRDSTGAVTLLEGDSIVYDRARRISRAFMFGAPGKIPTPMVLTDTAHKSILIGGYGFYNDSTGEALAADYPLLMEYSRPDTLFLRADTIKTFLITRRFWPEKVTAQSESSGQPEEPELTAQSELSEQPEVSGVSDVSILSKTSDTLDGTEIVEVSDDSSAVPNLPDNTSVFTKIIALLYPWAQPPAVQQQLPLAVADTLPRDSSLMLTRQYRVAEAFRRARFFKSDMQGVADSIVVSQEDSLLRMKVRPVVWSGERQVSGKLIHVHFNDSTSDWAELPQGGMMVEHIEEEFFNQLAGRRMLAHFEGQTLSRLDVDGNVQAIFLPMESDSTYNRLIEAESSYLTIEVAEGGSALERLKMWPEVTGTVTPVFLVKNTQLYLPGFMWLEVLRPRREWYGGGMHWADDLGEVPDELEEYLAAGRDVPVPRVTRRPRGANAVTRQPEPSELPEIPEKPESSENTTELSESPEPSEQSDSPESSDSPDTSDASGLSDNTDNSDLSEKDQNPNLLSE